MFADVLLPLSLTLIMGSLGLTLTLADFRRVVTAPRGVGIGLGNLLLISPLLAFLIADLYGLTAALAVGVVLLGASPGGTTANMLTHLAKGDVALSVSMTAVSSVASVITVPIFLALGASYFDAQDISDEISMGGIAARVFLITIVPLSIGMLIRARRTEWALRNMKRARTIALGAFVLVVAGAIATEFDRVEESFGDIAAAVVTLNVLAMTVSFLIARAAKLSSRQSTAIAMELGVHNTTVALAVATSVDDQLAGPAAVYGLFMFFTAGLFARFMSRRNADEPAGHVEDSEDGVEGFDADVERFTGDVEIEVPAAPDRVWRAIATAEGLSAWLAPARIQDDTLRLSLGALGEVAARIVASEEPRRFVFAEADPSLETELRLEAAGEGSTRVVVVNRLRGGRDEALLQDARASWAPHLAALRLHLEAEDGRSPECVEASRPADGLDAEAALAMLPGAEIERCGEHAAVARLMPPGTGHALAVVDDAPGGRVLTLRARLYGAGAGEAADRVREAWAGAARA